MLVGACGLLVDSKVDRASHGALTSFSVHTGVQWSGVLLWL